MEINNKTELLEFLRRESLRILSESGDNQVLSTLSDKVDKVEKYYISTDEKELEKLDSEEERAVEKEDYVDLQRIKEAKKSLLGSLIVAYKKKIELYEQLRLALGQDLESMGTKGNGVFKNKEIHEFSNEAFEKGTTLKIGTISSEITVQKISDNNQYKVLDSTAPGIMAGYIVSIPNTKLGSSAKLKVYRPMGDRYEEVGAPTLQNIKQITKNPS
jgi:hypothetical protein